MSKKPIKSNLFRFVTLRSPQLIEDKEAGFVSFPESKKAESLAFKAVETATTEEERKTALKGAFNTGFTPVANRVEVKNMHEALYVFSGWLMRNKGSLSYASIQSNLSDAAALTLDQERVIWDNLFYQTIKKESVSVRERLIQLLVANQFLKAFNLFTSSFNQETDGEIVFTEENEKEFKRRANASVIIPKEVLLSDLKDFANEDFEPSKDSKEYLASRLEVALAEDRIKLYETALKEVTQAELLYSKEEASRYQTELKAYNATIDQIKQDATPEIQRIINEEGFSKEVKTYPDLQLPKFEFTSATEIKRDVPGAYSSKTLELLNSNGISVYENFSEVKSALRDRIKKDTQLMYDAAPKETQKVNISGTTVTVNPTKSILPYTYSGRLEPILASGKSALSMSLRVGYTNAYVKQATYSLVSSTGEKINETGVIKISEYDNTLNLRFFSEGKVIGLGDYVFSGELTLSNDVKLKFNAPLSIYGDILEYDDIYFADFTNRIRYHGNYSGIAKKVSQDTGGSTGDSTGGSDEAGAPVVEETIADGVLYGVSQLGIADFRRVEQEVCCYVPGEVSHIENIMAREYKERSTRSLTSSESTTEKTSEREVENLTDTTSTERNELQNEASSIVNSDNATSFGANASVSAEFGDYRFGSGMNYNTSSSNSTSNSNSQAQVYAQEVTERALERVVQKISTKRTSRILREFEENNTHGFDNRKGDKHVTGVYRWVDKIYKNKLINYGKRLMYEFALPEPAKFYIESYLKVDKDTTPEGLIIPKEPIHPSELPEKIKKSSDLNYGNYANILARYGVEHLDYPEEDVYISKSYKLDFQDLKGQEGSVLADEIKIEENYVAKHFKVIGNLYSHDSGRVGGRLRIAVGNSLQKNEVRGDGDFSFESDASFSEIKDSLAVSASSFDSLTGNFNVVVRCIRTQEALKKWENEAYKAIMEAYNEQVLAYNDFIKSKETEAESKQKKKELSSQLNRNIEKRELKRIAIDLMTKPFSVVASRDNYKEDGKEKDFRYVARTPEFQKHAEVVKFFEQAFDWEIMAYTFYPYFYGEDTGWNANFKYNEGGDPIFQAFLQSGMARSVVPVRPGFEEAVNWYMKTGEIWNGQGMVTDMDDDLYVSIAEEMQTIEGEVEGTWETRVPTALTVLQADSVVLKEGGLPCNPDCEGQGLFDVSTYKIGDGPDGVDYDVVGETNNVA
ncbi:hypothetical protein [uncultured Tenacibaculum sp.]|uniref:hypothetical protein n=1 Tax=uncultured Tenacibaculum sp. TaxID=174713 RepID=UPI00262DCB57|nr:hypothetical protein [uncultured Tenacibaculum sp.]